LLWYLDGIPQAIGKGTAAPIQSVGTVPACHFAHAGYLLCRLLAPRPNMLVGNRQIGQGAGSQLTP
jgi:hypothetical protein